MSCATRQRGPAVYNRNMFATCSSTGGDSAAPTEDRNSKQLDELLGGLARLREAQAAGASLGEGEEDDWGEEGEEGEDWVWWRGPDTPAVLEQQPQPQTQAGAAVPAADSKDQPAAGGSSGSGAASSGGAVLGARVRRVRLTARTPGDEAAGSSSSGSSNSSSSSGGITGGG